MTPTDAERGEFQRAVLDWGEACGRKNLPWQSPRTPYRVWLSEIMLQQTQVATVIPYFLRFVERFPDLAALADASLESVLELWSGLGYYARGRNLHATARQLVDHWAGEFPRDLAALSALPGIGRSTAGAILSLGHGIRAPILDGNVKRVLSRHWMVPGWPGDTAVARRLWALSECLTPDRHSADYNQAMMDLGATICTARRAQCGACPVSASCLAHRNELTGDFPAPKPKKPIPSRQADLLVLRNRRGELLLERRPAPGVWGGLWCFPLLADQEDVWNWLARRALSPLSLERMPRRRHTFSHFHLDYQPLVVDIEQPPGSVAESGRERWHLPGTAASFGLPAPIRALLDVFASPATMEDPR